MSRVTGKPPTHWRRPVTRTYDYNMSLGENYYKPQLDYIDSRKGRGKTPPSATTFAERLMQFPPSRRSASATRRAEDSSSTAAVGGTTSFSSSAAASAAEASLGRYASLDDLSLDDDLTIRRRRQLIDQSLENLDRGTSPLLSSALSTGAGGSRHRVTFGDKVLDAVGVKEMGGSLQSGMSSSSSSRTQQQRQTSLMTGDEGDAIDKILSERRNRRQQGLMSIQSADPDLFGKQDPLGSASPTISSRLQQARREMDDMRDEMKTRETESSSASSRFRQRLRAKREREAREEQQDQMFGGFGGSLSSALNEIGSSSASASSAAASKARQFLSESFSSGGAATSGRSQSSQQLKMSSVSSSAQNIFDDDDSETTALLNKVDQIRKRAKARLAQITDDDFPDLQIGSSLASRRAAGRALIDQDDDFDSDFRLTNNKSSSSGGGRAVTVSKRMVSYGVE